mmetsp:Transcript_61929/g.130787  ORF Transcript_61929/g.130787 Transcript_61929/m.130787 type:complete len:181 (-) Transcript_61929:245-787(-)|eukprot:CAMPEP_0206451866 /NCGR_PEP_ID=MMETSP0324_2-20121206/19602_1 /ASSEMBLY_ACC=CAM_ASM_000836 /TAXON_ID=2866 /ORGANISM="Crypthecodinium cohnii, Strain Seligo" /LENGTH=180 /DNA_ID=CAMNT_0053921841 /DNA_START=77 /DNA_END=619 /DNA_ORIENTATION=+
METRSKSVRDPKAAVADDDDEDTPVIVHVRKKILDELRLAVKTNSPVSRQTLQALIALDDAEDDEQLVPVDLRNRLKLSAADLDAELKDPRLHAKAYILAEDVFVKNPSKTPEAQRPTAMLASEWKANEEEPLEEAYYGEEGEEEEDFVGDAELQESDGEDDDDTISLQPSKSSKRQRLG